MYFQPFRRGHRGLIALLAIFVSFAYANDVLGHASGENYVWVNIDKDRISGRFEINVNDLKSKLGIDVDALAETRVESVEKTKEKVQKYLKEHFSLSNNETPIEIEFLQTNIFEEVGDFAQYYYQTGPLKVPNTLTIKNDVFISTDDLLHRSLIVLEYNKILGKEYGGENGIMVFGPHNPIQELDLTNPPEILAPFDFIWEGVLHIWIGIDHILFLLALLLLAVVKREEGKWVPVKTFRSAIWNVFKIVTIFTVAHSITLSLAALNLINVESRFVESLIALSIVLVAINNIFPKFNERKWLVIFFFGLFHGMGFASVLGELPFRMLHLVKILLTFNVGVELGQLVIVAGVFPIIFLLRNSKIYQPIIVLLGSLVIGGIGFYWFIERAFAL